MSLDIRNIYNDALYWATSPQSKDKGYHISRVHDSVLRKLIHYCKNKEQVFYTNNVIAKHIYLGEEQVKKSIPLLENKGFIKCLHLTSRDDNNNIIKRRGIKINWNTIEKIMEELPNSTDNILEENLVDAQLNIDVIDETNLVTPNEITNDDSEINIGGHTEQVSVKYKHDDMLSLHDFFEKFGIDLDLAVEFLIQFRRHFGGEDNVRFGDVLNYVNSIVKEQKYNNYKGVRIDNDIAERFNRMILR
jgi:hypothetical protein